MYGEDMLIQAIPHMIEDFDISYNTASWILTAYMIAGAVMTPIVGNMPNIYGKKKIPLIVIVIYSLGTLPGGHSSNISTLLFADFIQGIGLVMFPVGVYNYQGEIFRGQSGSGSGCFYSSLFWWCSSRSNV